MHLTDDEVHRIFDRTDGDCYYCRKKLAFKNRGARGSWGAWEVDHKISRANGGTDLIDNLIAACYVCNRDKSDLNATSYRRLTKPLRVRRENAAIASELRGMAVPLAGLTWLGFLDIKVWWEDRKAERESGNTSPVGLKELPWLGIGCLLVVLVIVITIFRAHRGT